MQFVNYKLSPLFTLVIIHNHHPSDTSCHLPKLCQIPVKTNIEPARDLAAKLVPKTPVACHQTCLSYPNPTPL